MKLSQAKRENYPAGTCLICMRPMAYAKDMRCNSCYDDLSRTGNLLEKKESVCQTTSK